MAYRESLAAALVVTTFLGGAAVAAEQAAKPAAKPAAMQETPAQKAVDQDIGKLSKDRAQAFRDMHLARIAIFDADPAQAKSLIGKAQAALAKAKTDDAVFTKAEADLRTPTDMASGKAMASGQAPASATTSAADKNAAAPADTAAADKTAGSPATTSQPGKAQVAWVPVDAQLTLGEDFTATPEKASAVNEANKSLAKGDQTGAIEKLKLAHVDVNFVMAVLPLDKTAADVNQAASLIGQGKYYEANAVLKTAEDGMRFDVIDAVGLPRKAAMHAAAKPAQQNAATATDGKPAK